MANRNWQPEDLKLFVRGLAEHLGEYSICRGYRQFVPIPDDLMLARILAKLSLDPETEIRLKGFGDDGPLIVLPDSPVFELDLGNGFHLAEIGFVGPCGHGKKPLLVVLIKRNEFYWAEDDCHDCWLRAEEFLVDSGFEEIGESQQSDDEGQGPTVIE